jgi:hypothetical protein
MFNISEWPTPLTGDIPLNLSFSPSSPTVLSDDTNSGYYLYTLHIGGATQKPSTPGFEVVIILAAILVILAFRKRIG